MSASSNLDLWPSSPLAFPEGFHLLPGHLDLRAQRTLVETLGGVLAEAPLFEQRMPRTGATLSVRMSNAGTHGWVTERERGYRHQPTHPTTGRAWPAIPSLLVSLWHELTGEGAAPNQCLINYYDVGAKLGLHQDRGDGSEEAPVLSISLGDDATFVVGGLTRSDPKQKLTLHSGDVLWFGGPARLIFHGVPRIAAGTSTLLQTIGLPIGRLNVTLRRIDG